jgi:UV DNA damage endonuclease
MKIGYPCINRSIGCSSNKKFRLANFTREKFNETVRNNLNCLDKIVDYNVENNMLFLRISSETIPFASHEVCTLDWKKIFKNELNNIGIKLKENKFRVSMHPGQFTLLNSPNEKIVEKSLAELEYHADFLNAMGLDNTAKIQIHVGGVYGDKDSAIKRFINTFGIASNKIKSRLAIENDDYHYSVKDCLRINKETNIPIILDNLHLECLNDGESLIEAYNIIKGTWSKEDGIPMLDYSSQQKDARIGKHTEHLDSNHFKEFIDIMQNQEFDLMFEIKDKEKSVLEAQRLMQN